MRSLVASRPVMALNLCLILISSQVGESHRFGFFGLRMGEMTMFKGFGSAPAAPPSKMTDPFAPSPAPSPAPAPAPALAPAPGPASARSHPAGDFNMSFGEAVGLKVGFYDGKCSRVLDVEAIIAAKTQEAFQKDPTLFPAILRMQFHDCFVHGCDASILVDGPSTEKTSGADASVRGYEFIELVKATLEEQCPGVVSCADIIAVATKEFIKLGGGLDYPVQTGRRDGLVSRAQDVDLPSPDMTASQCAAAFGAKNFTAEEAVILLGAHSVGVTHCNFFQDRLRQGSPNFDSKMDPNLRKKLMDTCQRGGPGAPTPLNQDLANNNILDNTFYGQLLNNRGILPVDQDLSRNPETQQFVVALAQNNTMFNFKFINALLKLQALDVITGTQGNIRKKCSSIN